MSLRDQLLKAGLVSQEAVKKLESDKRKKTHQGKKDRKLGRAESEKKADRKKQQDKVAVRKRQQDRKLNQERDRERQRKANRSTILELLAKHRTNEKEANQVYNFQDGRFIRRVNVTDQQLFLIEYGKLGIIRNPRDVFDYPLVPREVALKVAQLDDTCLVVLHKLDGSGESENLSEKPAQVSDPSEDAGEQVSS